MWTCCRCGQLQLISSSLLHFDSDFSCQYFSISGDSVCPWLVLVPGTFCLLDLHSIHWAKAVPLNGVVILKHLHDKDPQIDINLIADPYLTRCSAMGPHKKDLYLKEKRKCSTFVKTLVTHRTGFEPVMTIHLSASKYSETLLFQGPTLCIVFGHRPPCEENQEMHIYTDFQLKQPKCILDKGRQQELNL